MSKRLDSADSLVVSAAKMSVAKPAVCDTYQLISLVTPSLNTAAFLAETLDSVLAQEYPRLEYVVVDGGSVDGSRKILEQYRNRLHALIIEPDDGHAHALNKGFEHSTGEIMGWINSDDILLKESLQVVNAVFSEFPEVEWLTGAPTLAQGGGGQGPGTRLKRRPGRNFTYGDFLAGDFRWIQQESTFWRRSLWERAGGRLETGLALAIDFELWMRFFRHARLYSVDAQIGAFRKRDGQRSAALHSEYLAEAQAVVQREKLLLANETLKPDLTSMRRSRGNSVLSRIQRRVLPRAFTADVTKSQVQQALCRRTANKAKDWR